MWLYARISQVLYGLQTWLKCQKTQQVLLFALEKNFCLGGAGFLSDIISGGFLGHLGQLHLALGPIR